MPRYYIPDEITEDYIDHICGCMKDDMDNVMDNDNPEWKQEMYDNAIETLKHIGVVLKELMPDTEE